MGAKVMISDSKKEIRGKSDAKGIGFVSRNDDGGE